MISPATRRPRQAVIEREPQLARSGIMGLQHAQHVPQLPAPRETHLYRIQVKDRPARAPQGEAVRGYTRPSATDGARVTRACPRTSATVQSRRRQDQEEGRDAEIPGESVECQCRRGGEAEGAVHAVARHPPQSSSCQPQPRNGCEPVDPESREPLSHLAADAFPLPGREIAELKGAIGEALLARQQQ